VSSFNFQDHLLRRDHTLRGGILFGIDGHTIELQGRATKVLKTPRPIAECCRITGVARGPVQEGERKWDGEENGTRLKKMFLLFLVLS
jgi:magnesium chelatase family protein